MSQKGSQVKKQTLYISIATSLLIGFVCGVLYSALQTPSLMSTEEHTHDQATAAIESLEQQTSNNPDDREAWVNLGHAYFDSDQPSNAIKAYRKALELMPGDMNVMTDLGVMYRRNKQPKEAIAIFDKVLQQDPNHEQARFNKGVVLLSDLDDRKAAIVEWKKLVVINPLAATPSGTTVKELILQLENQAQEP
ncbi:tetratricopeptide repeat protein [Desulfogranum marinum]|uniref:tetratricopeptide repeat protein n=1 Tax=Desulfogranum marinum TaxID=453220 RepID=UPI0019644E63|nr:tetratricopeptide repeat protein [Desulfogranum marinum]MBM9510873.1 tetratricopeptide repeat protein [Desulfogranum marinum]